MSFGGGGGTQYIPMPTVQTSSTNTSSEIPSWLTSASQYGINNATRLLSQPTTAYQGQLAPGLNADQMAAGQMIKDSMGFSQPYFDSAQSAINSSMSALNPSTLAGGLSGISQYMNPYISNVVDSIREVSNSNLGNALNQTRDQAIGAGAFGGSRHGVREGVAIAQNNRDTNSLLANLLQGGYNQATSMLGQDVQTQNAIAQQNRSNALAGGQAIAGLGTTARGANAADINNLMTYGSLGQQTTAAQQQAAYNEFLRQQNDPLQRQQIYNSTVSTAPHSTTGSSNTTSVGIAPQQQQTSSSPLMQGLGAAMGIGSMFAGGPTSAIAGLGSALGGAGGLLGWSPFPSSYSNPQVR